MSFSPGISMETEKQPLTLDKTQPLHFVGVGGVGMSGLAKILQEAGYAISGSDVAENAYTQQLVDLGATIYTGHQAEQVPNNAALIVSSSINRQNPEIAKALDLGLPIHHRSALLREILQGDRLGHESPIGITGTMARPPLPV